MKNFQKLLLKFIYISLLFFTSTAIPLRAQVISLPICNDSLVLTSPINNYSANSYWGLQAHRKIIASNKISGQAKVKLQAQSIVFKPGFQVNSINGAVLTTSLATYNPIGQFPLISIIEPKEPVYGNYCVDTYGGVYQKDVRIVYINPLIPIASVNAEALAAINSVKSFNPGLTITESFCPCNPYLRIWSGNGLDILDNNTIKIQGGKATTSPGGRVTDAELNYYASIDENNLPTLPSIDPLNSSSLNGLNFGQLGGDNNLKVALIDNGVDYTNHYFTNPNVKFTFWKNNDDPINGIDDDNNGFVDDIAGWNFISKNNNPLNNTGTSHLSHGTKVLSIIFNKFINVNVPFEVILLKTTDERGVGKEFDLDCAMYYAMQKGAKVINASLCSYKPENQNDVLKRVVSDLKQNDVMLIAAAGNGFQSTPNSLPYPVNLDESKLKSYPASLGVEFNNVYSITSVNNTATVVCNPLNYGGSFVDIGVKTTDDCFSLCPIDNSAVYGTSFGSPVGTAAIIKEYYNFLHGGSTHGIPTKDRVLDPNFYIMSGVGQNPVIEDKIKKGFYLNN